MLHVFVSVDGLLIVALSLCTEKVIHFKISGP